MAASMEREPSSGQMVPLMLETSTTMIYMVQDLTLPNSTKTSLQTDFCNYDMSELAIITNA
eukprot:250545-Amphidinium_carterae.1